MEETPVPGVLTILVDHNMDDEHSLEQTLRDENTLTSLPVLTIGSLDRIGDRGYREQSAMKLFEVVLDLDRCRGRGRIFLP
jgi:hypothetical protein